MAGAAMYLCKGPLNLYPLCNFQAGQPSLLDAFAGSAAPVTSSESHVPAMTRAASYVTVYI